jgi:nicotinamidase-related amidase
MNMTLADRPALILIDIQNGLDELDFYGGRRNNPDAEKNASRLLTFWRKNGLPIFHVKHNSSNPDSPLFKGKPGNEIKEEVKPVGGEPVFEKNVNSAFIGTNLQEVLDNQGIKKLVIVGLTTEHCISTSTRMAGNLGYDTFLVGNATAAFDKVGPNGKKYPAEVIHEAELASLHGEFAMVVGSFELLEQLEK